MKIKEKNSFGIPVKVSFSKKELEKHASEPLKELVKVYRKQLNSRDKYIKKIHKAIRDKRNLMMASYIVEEVSSAMPKALNKKKMMILAELYDKDYLSEVKLRELMKKIGMSSTQTGSDFKYLTENNLIQRHNRASYYITDQGKQFVEYYHRYCNVLLFNMLANRGEFKIAQAKRKVNMTEELRKLRSDNYRNMMQPFWDNGLNKMPKDRSNRCTILYTWMKANGKEQDEFYNRMLHRWSSKK